MQGEGTQGNPYIPTAWDEFVYAVGKDKETYVTMPEGGGVFDMNDIAPTGGITVNVNCLNLEGNDWEIRNAYNARFYFNGAYDEYRESGNWIAYALGNIHKLHFLNFYSDSQRVIDINIGKLSECKISGIIAGKTSALYKGEFERCSMNLKFIDDAWEVVSGDTRSGTLCSFVKAVIDHSDSKSNASYDTIYANNSFFEHMTNANGLKIYLAGNSNVVKSDLQSQINTSTGTRIDVTEEQLKDAAYLRSIGFPIAGD